MVKRHVLGKEHEFKEVKVDIFKLKYYPENPRVHHIISGLGKNVSQDKIEKTMWDQDSTKDLFMSIKKSGLQDPILISEDYKVMEGNTRLCAYRFLFYQAKKRNDKKEMKNFRMIQCEMYPPGLDRLGMHHMLGRWHIVQKKEWDAFEKAGYIRRLMKEFSKSIKDIADELTMSESDIKKMLWSENIMVEEKVSNIKLYSHVEQCHQSPFLRDKINEDNKFKKRIVKIIKSGNMGKAQNIRRLPKIIKENPNGIDMLEKGVDFDVVYSKTLEENPEDNPIFKDMDKIQKKIKKLDTAEFIKEIKKEKDKKELVEEFFNKVSTIQKICKKEKII